METEDVHVGVFDVYLCYAGSTGCGSGNVGWWTIF